MRFAGRFGQRQGLVEDAECLAVLIRDGVSLGEQGQEGWPHQFRSSALPRGQSLANLLGGVFIIASTDQRPPAHDSRRCPVQHQAVLGSQCHHVVRALLRHRPLAAKLVNYGFKEEGVRKPVRF